ncbi:hypothetical protein D9757_010752 [Collybiopsis confluens]|uniref:HAT C-terminal dimerisation domain-containing protein n=1 Tax=Collybiopsis confluens TaxID=2823264 RepID=A0A8H5H943_9AGAR|nr:hypothetical protein D9757_010752 [Collybiopsis confluens]
MSSSLVMTNSRKNQLIAPDPKTKSSRKLAALFADDSNEDDSFSTFGSGLNREPWSWNIIMYCHGQQFGNTWISLARDYLSIMGASTSSERAFSRGGLIITKLRN